MLQEFREQHLIWDKANRRIHESVKANASDSKGRKLTVQVLNDGVVEDLTGTTLSLYWETRSKQNKGLDAFDVVDASQGIFELYYTTGMLSNEGKLRANLVLVDDLGRIVSDAFVIDVSPGIDDDAVESSDSFTALAKALVDVQNLEQNYAPRLNEVTAQLAQTEEQVFRGLNQKVGAGKRASLNDLSEEVLRAIDNGSGTEFTILSEPADKTVTQIKTTFIDTGKNLFNKRGFFNSGYYVETNGSLIPSSTFDATDYIYVEGETDYSTSYLHNVAFYDGDKKFISATTAKNFTTPANTQYIRTSFPKNMVDTYQVEKGKNSTEYEEYIETLNVYVDGRKIYPDSVGSESLKRNAVQVQNADFLTTGKNLFDKYDPDIIKGKYLNAGNGALLDFTGYYVSGYIPVEPNTEYIRSFDHMMCYYDEEKRYIGGRDLALKGSFITPSNCAFIRTSINEANLDTFQLEKGNKRTSYEEFGYLLKKDWHKNNPPSPESHYKKATFFGDSQTEMNLYPRIVQGLSNIPEILVEGLSGSSMTYIPNNTVPDFMERANEIDPSSDLIVVYGSVNDYHNHVAIGDRSYTGNDKFVGALKILIEYLTLNYPDAKLIFVTAGQRINGEKPNGSGHTLIEYVDAMIDVCGELGVTVVDIYRNAGINRFNIDENTTDGLHWNEKGAEKIAKPISGAINTH